MTDDEKVILVFGFCVGQLAAYMVWLATVLLVRR